MISWNLGPLHLSAALPYIAQTMQKGAAVVLLQEVLVRKGTKVKIRRELRQMFPKYECYISVGSHVDVENDGNDATLDKEYAQQSANHSSHFPTQKSFSKSRTDSHLVQTP